MAAGTAAESAVRDKNWDQFLKNLEARTQQQGVALKCRCKRLAASREVLDADREDLKRRMAARDVAFSRNGRDLVNLNVGGTPFTVRRSALTRVEGSRIAALFNVDWGDTRLPRDSSGCIFLDESPSSFEVILSSLLNRGTPMTMDEQETQVLLRSVDFFGLAEHVDGVLSPFIACLKENSTTLIPASRQADYIEEIKRWCPGSLISLKLLYRGTRDGFTSEDFHRKCDHAAPTLTLVRCGEAIVGGYSDQPWSGPDGYQPSSNAFLFSLRNSLGLCQAGHMPIMPTEDKLAVWRGRSFGPCFGAGYDLAISLPPTGLKKVSTQFVGRTYQCSGLSDMASSVLKSINGSDITEMEVFGVVATRGAPPADGASPAPRKPPADADKHRLADLHMFGAAVAGELQREQAVLEMEEDELDKDLAAYTAAEAALAAMEGSIVAQEGADDPIVKINVGGRMISTLRSTLCLCPESALTKIFQGNAGSPTSASGTTPSLAKLDGAGCLTLQCDPSLFGKIVDVLRARKRSKVESQLVGGRICVGISPADLENFESLVAKLFPGNEPFIMDWVDTGVPGCRAPGDEGVEENTVPSASSSNKVEPMTDVGPKSPESGPIA